MSRNAEAVAGTILAGQPDIGMSCGVMADRTTLHIKLQRALGAGAKYPGVQRAFNLYGPTLCCADPLFGQITADHVDRMRQAEQGLHRAIQAAARDLPAWHLFKHERVI